MSPEISFEVYCAECNDGLCSDTEVRYRKNGTPELYIKPCQACVDKAREAGVEEGREQAENEHEASEEHESGGGGG